jgi:hypothetical protein
VQEPQPITFRASGETTAFPDISEDGDKLGVDGIVVDRISYTGEVLLNMEAAQSRATALANEIHPFWMFLSALRKIRREQRVLVEWGKIAKAHSKAKYVTRESAIDAYWQTLIGGKFTEGRDIWKSEFRD